MGTPALRRLVASDNANASCGGDNSDAEKPIGLEEQLLASIGGHSLCCDVFGEHSKGEVEKGGALFHGEAGLTTWNVVDHARTHSCIASDCISDVLVMEPTMFSTVLS